MSNTTRYISDTILTDTGNSDIWSETASVVSSLSSEWNSKMTGSTNLEISKFGSNSFLQPDVKGSFDGPQSTVYTKPFFIKEKNGSVFGLRAGTDGIKQSKLYYWYASDETLSDITTTDSEYRPLFLSNNEFASNIIDANEHGFYVEIRNSTSSVIKHYWININGTLNSLLHTYVDVSTLADSEGLLFNSGGSLVYCPEHSIYIAVSKSTNGGMSQKTLSYKIFDSSFNLKGSYSKTLGWDGISGTHDITLKGLTGIHTVNAINNAQMRCNTRYYVDGDDVCISDLNSFMGWASSSVRRIGYNSVFKYNVSSSTFTDVYPGPHVFDWSTESPRTKPFFAFEGIQWDPSFNFCLYRSPNSNLVCSSYKTWGAQPKQFNVRIWSIASGATWKDVVERPWETGSNPLVASTADKAVFPTDASYLGKEIQWGSFVSPTKFRSYSFSNKAGGPGPSYNWTISTILDTTARRSLISTNDSLEAPSSVELDSRTTHYAPRITTLDSTGTMRVQTHSGYDIVSVDADTGTTTVQETLPSSYLTQIDGLLAADTNYTGYDKKAFYLYRLNPDTYLLAYAYKKTGQVINYCSLLNYNSGTFSWRGTKQFLRTHASSAYLAHHNFITGLAYCSAGIYTSSTGEVYSFFTCPGCSLTAGNYIFHYIMKTDSSVTDIVQVKEPSINTRTWTWSSATIHPTLGPHISSGHIYSSSAFKLYCNIQGGSSLNDRMVNSFTDMFVNGTPDQIFGLTLAAGTGFIFYSTETPVFLDGQMLTLAAGSWNMDDPLLWIDGKPVDIRNQTFRAYVKKTGPTEVSLVFSSGLFADTNDTMYVGDVVTGATGITSSLFKKVTKLANGLEITSEADVIVNKSLGIKTLPGFDLHLAGDSAAKPATNTWTIASDKRIKTDITNADVDICYNIVKNLPLQRYTWRTDIYSEDQVKDRTQLGWIAQEVEKIFPKGVTKRDTTFTPTSGTETKIKNCRSLNSDQIYAALYGAVQKLIDITEKQSEEIALLKQNKQ